MDGDGDLDLLTASIDGNKIGWYKNSNLDFGDAPAPYPTNDVRGRCPAQSDRPPVGRRPRSRKLTGSHSGTPADGGDDDGVTFGAIRSAASWVPPRRSMCKAAQPGSTPGSTSMATVTGADRASRSPTASCRSGKKRPELRRAQLGPQRHDLCALSLEHGRRTGHRWVGCRR